MHFLRDAPILIKLTSGYHNNPSKAILKKKYTISNNIEVLNS